MIKRLEIISCGVCGREIYKMYKMVPSAALLFRSFLMFRGVMPRPFVSKIVCSSLWGTPRLNSVAADEMIR